MNQPIGGANLFLNVDDDLDFESLFGQPFILKTEELIFLAEALASGLGPPEVSSTAMA